MLKQFFPTIIICSFVLSGCSSNETSSETTELRIAEEDTTGSSEPLYPYVEYIQDQIAYVDSTPFGIEKIVSINGITIDSGFIQKDIFLKEAQAFLEVNPNDSSHKKLYKETSFSDLTIDRVTFSISAKEDSLILQQADILVSPKNDAVKNVILRKQFTHPDSTVTQTLLWTDKMQFQVSENINPQHKKPYTRVTKIVWDKPLE
jgi:hypothetical protein